MAEDTGKAPESPEAATTPEAPDAPNTFNDPALIAEQEDQVAAKPEPAPAERERDEAGRFVKTTHTHSPIILHMAQELGLPEDVVRATPPEDLRLYIAETRAERRAAPKQEQVQGDYELDMDKFDFGLDEDNKQMTLDRYDKGLVKFIKGVVGKIQSLESENKQFKAHHEQNLQAQKTQQWEKLFADPALAKVAGKGNLQDLPRSSAEFSFRMKIAKAANGDPARAAELLDIFKAMNAKPSYDQPEPQADAIKQWNNGALGKATSKVAAPAKGIDAAKRKFLELTRGLTQDEYDSE